MRKFKSALALLVAAVIALSTIMVSIAQGDATLPETDTKVNAVGSWEAWYKAAYTAAHEQSGIEYIDAANGIARKGDAEAYVVYKVAKASPFIAEFKLYRSHTEAKPAFLVSADGTNYTALSMEEIVSGDDTTYYTDSVGENNQYVKIIVSDVPGSHWMCDMRTVSFNGNTESGLPETDTTLDFVSDYTVAAGEAYEQYGVFRYDNGMLGNKLPDSYVVYKVADNSPVMAEFKYMPTGSERPLFYASSDGKNWSALSMSVFQNGAQVRTYYSNAIGAGNKFVKIVICDTAIAEVWRCDMQKLSFNAPEAEVVPETDTTLDFVNDYTNAISKAYKCRSDILQVYQGGLSGGETPESYVIYKVEKNSPVKAHFKLFTDLTTGRPEFYVSPDGTVWTKKNFKAVQNGQYTDYTTSGIGAENKFIKIVISDTALSAPWHVDLQQLSFIASTEADVFPETDTTLDFLANGQADLDRAFRVWNFGISPEAGYKNAAYATKSKNNYIIINTADNSPFKMNMRVHDSMLGEKVNLYASNDPNDSNSWVPLDVTRVQPQAGGYNTWSYYATGIGVGYTYVKINLSAGNPWAFCIEDISYSAGEHIGRDDSGYVEPDPDDKLPKTDTVLDFTTQYNAALNQAYMFSPDLFQIWQGGLGGSKTPDSYVIYKVKKNSPVIATFKIFANDTNGRPEFYASPDGKTWEQIELVPEEEIKGNIVVRYISEGIGEDNCYLKVVISNEQVAVAYYADLQKLAFNANTDPLPYDLNLNFVSDAVALARIYSITPAKAFEHLLNTGLLLNVDYISGQQNLVKPRMTFAVKPGSGLMAQFKVSIYAEALDMFPKFYVSADGKNWDLLEDYEIFSTGSDAHYTSYRLMTDSLDKKYEFVSFEYPQTKDYAGTDIAELDDYVPDCLNAGVILTNISFMRSEKYIGLAGSDIEEDAEDEYESEEEKSPFTGDKGVLAVCAVAAAVSLFAVVMLKTKERKSVR